MARVSLFWYVFFYFSGDIRAAGSICHLKINYIAEEANLSDSCAREMKCDSFDEGEDGEYNSVVFVEVCKIFVTEAAALFGMASLD